MTRDGLIERMRDLPKVDALARSAPMAPIAVAVHAARQVIDEARVQLHSGRTLMASELELELGRRVRAMSSRTRVLNGTGVMLHTNLGRAPVAPLEGSEHLGAVPLEVDLATGRRGRRFGGVESAICAVTGATGALVVNNNAAAVLLAMGALAHDRQVVVSRGQLVEIGGEFRIPDIISQSGAVLVEVGTTNRTHAEDYRRAIGSDTAVLLQVHPSNFRVVGFTSSVPTTELARIAHSAGVHVVVDLGSGLLDAECPWLQSRPEWVRDEPGVRQALAAGADLVTFSGDKLLGGPQAGVICGRAELVDMLRDQPLARALRFDKVRAGHLLATLDAFLAGTVEVDVPFWQMATADLSELRTRASSIVSELCTLHGSELGATTVRTEDVVGAGSAPAMSMPGIGIALHAPTGSTEALAQRLREGTVPVIGRVRDEQLVVSLRTIPPREDAALVAMIAEADVPSHLR